MVSTFPRLADGRGEGEDEDEDGEDEEAVPGTAERPALEERTQIPSSHRSVMLHRMVLDFTRFPEQKYSRTRISPSHASWNEVSVLVPSSVIKASRVFPFVFISIPPSESAHSYLNSALGGIDEETVGTTDGAIPFETASFATGVLEVVCETMEAEEPEPDFEAPESDLAHAPRIHE